MAEQLDGGATQVHHSRASQVQVQTAQRCHDRRADADTLLYDINAYAAKNTRFALDVEMEYSIGEGIQFERPRFRSQYTPTCSDWPTNRER
jgi:hypothetical protein